MIVFVYNKFYGVIDMHIYEFLDQFESYLQEFDQLLNDYNKAKAEGNEHGAQRLLREQKQKADEVEAWVEHMEDCSWEGVEEEQTETRMMVAIDELMDKLMQLDPLLEQYNRAKADGDEVGVRRLKKQMEGLSKKIEKLDLDAE